MTILAALAVLGTGMLAVLLMIVLVKVPPFQALWALLSVVPALGLVLVIRRNVKQRLQAFTDDVNALTEETLDAHHHFTWEGDTCLEPLAAAINRLRERNEQFRNELELQQKEQELSSEGRTHKLVEENRMLHQALNALPQAVCWKNDKLHFLGCNTRFMQMVGEHSIIGIVGKTDYDLKWRTEDANDMREHAKQVMQSGEAEHDLTERHQDKAGNITWYEVSRVPLTNADGAITGVLDVYANITERKAGEDTLKRAKLEADAHSLAKSEFLSKISKEMRMPLSSIKGMVDVLSEPEAEGDQRDFLDIIYRASESLLELVDDLRTFAELESGQVVVQAMPFHVHTLLQDVIDECAPAAQQKGLNVQLDIHGALPERMMGDAESIQRVLQQLATNALKFTNQGGVTMRALLESKAHPKVQVRFEIEDTGCGLTEEQRRQIEGGDDFMYGSHYAGLGLGLAISRGLVGLMSGSMGADSVESGGTCFWVSLPLRVDIADTALMAKPVMPQDAALLKPQPIIASPDRAETPSSEQ